MYIWSFIYFDQEDPDQEKLIFYASRDQMLNDSRINRLACVFKKFIYSKHRLVLMREFEMRKSLFVYSLSAETMCVSFLSQ